METEKTGRGFINVLEFGYQDNKVERLIGESSAIGDYEDSMDKPGSSYLWVGNNFHLNREQVKKLIGLMEHWIKFKRLPQDANYKNYFKVLNEQGEQIDVISGRNFERAFIKLKIRYNNDYKNYTLEAIPDSGIQEYFK